MKQRDIIMKSKGLVNRPLVRLAKTKENNLSGDVQRDAREEGTTEKTQREGERNGKKGTQPKTHVPFTPSEKVTADQVVDFPYDI
ncbi:hypothetical protein ACFL9T_17095 [Thermodesulfobacteriota bacterium]